ncbi:MAG TPA: hypothetical protein VK809_00235 [Bacteroidia bacterium]|nr:hypothetical protein [Bacteroidia bacterium]
MPKSNYPAIYIEWCDAMSNNDSWETQDQIIAWADTENWVIRQVGFIIKETKEYILLASKYNPQDTQIRVDGCIKIPKTWVRKRKAISSF